MLSPNPKDAVLGQHPIRWDRKAIPSDRIKLLTLLKRAGNFIG